MIAPSRPFVPGNSCPRATPRAAPSLHGSPSKPCSGSSRRRSEMRVTFRFVPYDFSEYEPDPEPQASGRFGGPPRESTGIGVLDPPVPPKRPPGPIPDARTSLVWRIAAALLLAGLAVMTFFMLIAGH